ncbi:ATP synthase F1 subunit gamma [Dictyobacter arantiisoli]|uniref:ATP synthase gamma chain n=1 Tax=Dictyobacter arantiisoli TaxID=2014874 RepID=A0A5A5TEC1_9CHLR|nr:ATP synthase F1 subunit gamma [Dictyobacter arantiisoli]GCF09359.1 ATP synthase gamma chain [Dictyobacter arantiisoli]
MPSLREIRQRIRSVKNTAKITKAMQMVASSKMRRSQERVEQSRPYADQIRELTARLAAAAASGNDDMAEDLALLKQRPVRNIGIVLISPDRGLCGALPSNINRHAAHTAQDEIHNLEAQGRHPGVSYIAVGKKGRDFVLRTEQNLIAEFTDYGDHPAMDDATAMAHVAVDAFLKGEVDVVYLVYAKYVNTVTQTPTTVQLLPVQPPEHEETAQEHETNEEYIYEPNEQELFKALLPRYVDVQIYQALLENIASQYAAQMISMKNATDNANELVQDLNLTYNKARQAAITTQILEVVSGAAAL